MESRRAGGGGSCYSVLVVVEDSLAGALLPRACDMSVRDAGPLAATSPSLGMWSQNLFSGFFMDGAVELTQNFSQSPSWMVVVVVGGAGEVFSLLTLEDQVTKHLGGCQESPRPWLRPLVDGQRHENSWTPGSSGQFPCGFPSWSGSIGLHVWQCGGGCGHPGNAREPSGLGRQDPASSLGPKTCTTPALQELGWLPHVGQEGSWAQTQRRPRPRSLPLDLDAGILRVRWLGLGGWLLGGPVEVDHVQVGIGKGVLRRGRSDGLNAGVFSVVVGLRGPGG